MQVTLRRRTATLFAIPLLLGSASAASPLLRAANADIVQYKETFYSDATYTTQVGAALGYCDGDYIWQSGYSTAYSKIAIRNTCP